MDIHAIDSLISEFKEHANITRNDLNTVLSLVTEGKIPSEELKDALHSSLGELQGRYNNIYQAVKENAIHVECPDSNVSVDALSETIKKEAAARLHDEVKAARETLDKFMHVTSTVERYLKALEPFQSEAGNMLRVLTEKEMTDEVSNAIQAQKVFLRLIEEELEDEEQDLLLDFISERYSATIQKGLAKGKYVLDFNNANDAGRPLSTPEKKQTTNKDETNTGNTNHKTKTPESKVVKPGTKSEPQNTPAGNKNTKAGDIDRGKPSSTKIVENNTEKASNQENKPVDKTGIDQDEAKEVVYIEAESKIKTGKTTASSFKQDIEKKCPHESLTIVPVLSQLGVATKELLVKHFQLFFLNADINRKTKNTELVLNQLVKMGYVVKYSLKSQKKFIYCLTNRAAECLEKKSVIGMQWDAMIQVPFFIGLKEVREDKVSYILEVNELLYRYFEYIRNPDDKCIAWRRAFELNLLVDEVEVRDKENKSWYKIANSELMKSCPENQNILIVDRKYSDFSPTNHILYLDEIKNMKDVKDTHKNKEEAPINENVAPHDNNSKETVAEVPLNKEKNEGEEKLYRQDVDQNTEKQVSMPDTPTEKQESVNEEINDVPDDGQNLLAVKEANEIDHSDVGLLKALVEGNKTPTDGEFYEIIMSFLKGTKGSRISDKSPIIEAVLMAKAAAGIKGNRKCSMFYKQLLLATRLPLEKLHYSSENLAEVFTDDKDQLEAAKLAAYMNALVYPERSYDYGLTGSAKSYLRDFNRVFPNFPSCKALFSELNVIDETIPSGFSPSVLARLSDAVTSEKYVSGLQNLAKDYMNVPVAKARLKFLPILYSKCFGSNSDLYSAMGVIASNDIDNLDLVKACLLDYCEDKSTDRNNNNEKISYNVEEIKIGNKLDEFWYASNGNNSRFPLEFGSRTLALRYFEERIQLMKDWVEYAEGLSANRSELSKIRGLREKIRKSALEAQTSLEKSSVQGKELLLWTVKSIINDLYNNAEKTCTLFSELLYTGVISLNDSGIPILDEDWNQIKYYEPWRLLLRHIELLLEHNDTYDNAKEKIFDSGSDLLDNLRQLKLISERLGTQEDLDYVNKAETLAAAKNAANDNKKKFQETLELYYTYGRINEVDKETLLAIANQYQSDFYDRRDFGVWKQFLKALLRRADEIYDSRRKELQKQLDIRFNRIKENEEKTPPILVTAQKLLNEDNNFAVAEEYINQFDNGNKEETLEEIQSSLYDPDSFADFLADRNFESLYNVCKKYQGKLFRTFGIDYCISHFPKDWTSRLRDDSIKLIESWPLQKGATSETQIRSLFNGLGLNVEYIQKKRSKTDEIFELRVTPFEKSRPDYPHPIAKFGTQMKSPLNVVVLYGYPGGKQLVDKISEMNLGEFTIVLIDYFLDRPKRRQIAEEFHGTSGQNSFLFIDQVLALFLALHQITERLPILLKCTLPYTTYQPFVRDGGSTAEEMFCGRTVELATLIDPNGACVVYGGRQLGKTALLERTESRCSKPEEKRYAVYSSLFSCNSEQKMTKKICEDIAKKTNLPRLNAVSVQALCDDIDKMFSNKRINTLYLLLDEADSFLDSISGQDYKPLQPLIDLKRKLKNNFKFVIAGLHNVCRAQNATARNGVFGQLGTPLCIKPLSPTDALQLLSRPLKYLGFQVDRYPHLETILTQTNYYPGILQFFGYKLIENLIGHYSKHYRAVDGHPPFTLEDDLLGELISSGDLNKSIADKFRLSLKLDERYFMIARCIALLHYDQDEKRINWLGYKIQEIIDIAKEFPIFCLEKLNRAEYLVLLDEMVDMGILSRPETGYYRLRKSSFIQIIGRDYEAVFEDIDNNNKGLD